MVGVDRSLGDWRDMWYLAWKERHAFWKGRPVLAGVDIKPFRESIRLISSESRRQPHGALDPTHCNGFIVFVDVHDLHPMESIVVLDRQFLRKMRRKKALWQLSELRSEYAATSLPWAA